MWHNGQFTISLERKPMNRLMWITACSAAVAVTACYLVGAPAAESKYLSPVALVADQAGKTLYVAEATAKQVAVLDVAGGKVTKNLALPAAATGLALSPDGKRLYVTCGVADGSVVVIDLPGGKVSATLPAGHSPVSPVVSPDGKTLYVCNRFKDNVLVIDLGTKKEVAQIAVARQPVAAAITPDGKTLVVANHLPAVPADADHVSGTVSIIDTTARKVVASITLPNGSVDLRGAAVSPDGKYAAVTHILGRFNLPTTQLERGWMNTNALSIIDINAQKLVNTVLLDDVDLGAANPWGVAWTGDGKQICVTHAGTHEVSVIDADGLMKKLAKADQDKTAENVPNNLAFLVELRRRIRLTGNGPRGLAVIGTKVYAAEYFTDSIGIIDITPDARPNAKSIALGPKQTITIARQGEIFFNDADLCFQKWQSCASCHPDGRVDGLNWDLLSDGMGNPKNVKSMLLAHKTPPSMVTGVRDKAETAVRAGIRHILFAVRPEEDAAAIDEFLKSLKPVPSPYLVKGKLSEAAKRGQKLFASAGCATCHAGPLYTDLKMYNIGLGKDRDEGRKFDTPTLVEAWRTGPYLFDGRAATMMDVLKKDNKGDTHGKTSKLSDKQRADLAEFVLSQ